jgi:hypothetical protein
MNHIVPIRQGEHKHCSTPRSAMPDGNHVSSMSWRGVLGYEVLVDQPHDWMVLHDPGGNCPCIGLQVVPESKVVKNRGHLDLVPTARGLEEEIRGLESLGANRVRYVENDPDESHWIVADPEGNEFCVSRPPWGPRPDQPEVCSGSCGADWRGQWR